MFIFRPMLVIATVLLFVSCNSPTPEESTKDVKSSAPQEKFKTYTSPKLEKILEERPNITIAVMPLSSKDTSETMVDFFRKDIMDKLEYKGYSVIDPKKLDIALREFGLKTPEKVKTIDKDELKDLTSADFLLYSTLKSVSKEGKIFYSGFLLLQDLNRDVMWSSLSNLDIEKKEGVDPLGLAVDAVVSGGVGVLGILLDMVRAENEEYKGLKFFTDSLLSTLPDGPREVVLDDGLLNSATELK